MSPQPLAPFVPASGRSPTPRLVRTSAWLAVIAALVVGPAYLFTTLTLKHPTPEHPVIAAQVDVEGRAPDPALVARLRAAAYDPSYPPAVITYHDLADDGSHYTITPQAFADQMRLLHDSGWHPLDADEFLAWLKGASLPPHSVLITFDDGARGVWRYADPVFRRYGMRGVAFVITGFVGTHQPYYMTWPELDLMRASGRWDLGAHTDLGHIEVPTDTTGRRLPFLTTPMWLPDQQRQETLTEFSTRVRTDLERCVAALVAHGAPRPELFAYPFSAVGESAVGARLDQIVSGMFDAAFLDSPAGRPTTQQEVERRQFRRVDMLRSTTPHLFVTGVEDALQRTVPVITPQTWRRQMWLSTSAAPVRLPSSGPVPLTAKLAQNRWGEIQMDPDHTSFWTDYRSTVVVSGLEEDVAGSVHSLLHSPDQVQVVVSSSRYLVYRLNGPVTKEVARGKLPSATSRRTVTTTVRVSSVEVSIDGRRVARLPTERGSRGGVAVGGDPLHQRRVPRVDSVSVTPLGGRQE